MASRADLKLDWLNPDLINHLIQRSKNNPSRVLYERNASRWRQWYRGETFLAPNKEFDDTSIPEVNATARRNIIGETVDAVSSIFLKNTPIITRIPFRSEWASLTDDIDSMFLWQWKQSFGQTIMRSILEDCEITGLAGGKVYWDHRKRYRRQNGGVAMISTPMTSLFVDPKASNDHRGHDASYIIEKMKRYPEEIIAKYGEPAEAALGWGGKGKGRPQGKIPIAWQMLNMDNEKVTGRIDGQNTSTKYYPPSSSDSDNEGKVDFYEIWLFPDLLYGNELSGGDEVPENYRFGIVANMVNDQIIRVRTNPFARKTKIKSSNQYGQEATQDQWIGHGLHPYVFMHWRRIADKQGNRKFYDCMSMIEWMVSLQFNVNALRRNMAIIMRTLANPVVAYNEDALATPANQVVFAPGQMLKVRGRFRLDEAIKVIQPTTVPPQVQQFINEDITAIKEAGALQPGVSGLFPKPGGGTSHTSGDVIGGLQEAAFGPLWKYVEGVGDTLEDVSTRYEGLMQQFCEDGHYMAASRRAENTMVEWTGEHRIAQFRRIVISGATTPVYDLQREQREGLVKQMTDEAIQLQNPTIIRSTIIFMGHMNFPWTADYLQLLQEELQKLEQVQQGLQQFGLAQSLGGGQAPLALPAPGQQGQEAPDIQGVAESMGVSLEQLMAAVANK